MIYRYISGYSSLKKKKSRSEYFAYVNNGNLTVKYYTTLAAQLLILKMPMMG